MKTNLRCFRLACILLFVQTGPFTTQATSAVRTGGVLSVAPKPLRQALAELEKRFNVSIVYNSDLINDKFVSDRDSESKSVEEALKYLLMEHGLHFRKAANGFYYIFAGKSNSYSRPADPATPGHSPEAIAEAPGSPKEFSGRVTEAATGRPLPGVTVQLKGTAEGTMTDTTGAFTLSSGADEGTLILSCVGYTTREVAASRQRFVDISLQQDVTVLKEAVVIGYGTQDRRDITGAISVVKSADIGKMLVTGLDQALQGQASGVFVSSNSGAPGSDVMVRIRGTGTIGNNNPLYVIDGTPTGPESLNLFNPRDIESVVVLKDAAAASIYGSRAANGVILVTTKKGKTGETRVSFDTYYGLQTAWRLPRLLNVPEYATIINEAYINAGKVPAFGRPDTLGANHDWLRELFRTAPTQNYNLSVSGGTEKSQYALSAAYLDQQGILPNSDFKRVSFRLNTSYWIKSKWQIGQNLTISHSSGNQIRTNELGGVLANAVYKRPFDAVHDDNGKYAESAMDPNPIAQAYRTENRRNRLRLFGNIFTEYEIASAVKFRSNFGLDLNYSRNKNYVPAFGATPNSLVEYADMSYSPLWQNSLAFNKSIGEQHSLSAIVSLDAQSGRYEFLTMKGDNFITDDPDNRYITAAQNIDLGRVDGNATAWSLLSLVGRLNYAFLDRYLFSASFRRDGTSRFAKGHRWGNFPSFSAAWRISGEPFLRDKAWLSDLKVRASWGQLGNQEVGDNYAAYNTVSTGLQYAFGPGSQTYYDGLGIPTNGRGGAKLASDKLVWEASTQTDVGIDIGFFTNQLQLTADYFLRKTSDMLLDQPVSSLSGASTVSVNAGSIRNRGAEVSISMNRSSGDFKYGAGFNATYLENKVLALNPGISYILGPVSGTQGALLTRTFAGDEVGSFYGYVTDGVFQNIEEVKSHAKQEIGTAAGDIRFKDLNNDHVINAKDQTKIGSPIPDWLFGINGNIGYKGFEISLLFQGVYGNKIYNQLAMRAQSGTNLFNKFADIRNRWTGEGTSYSEPRVHISDPNNNARVSDRWVEDGSYLRLKNLQIGYVVPAHLTQKAGLSRIRLYATAQNLLTWTRYSGFDPEMGPSTEFVDGRGADLEVGADKGKYPQSRTITFGMSLIF
ncbi:SusC/RagA family TonB-linked outer membrane protein [Dyadobacter sp. BHUBP1]|uniref:SusC/RagA family TonB-linked outer membrane protein n=1 Tax=Dyadobacter sp. BHUBP1 TaxID=3424178 RepID=UPI003D3566B5